MWLVPLMMLLVPLMMLLMMRQPHFYQPWRLDRCNPFHHILQMGPTLGYYAFTAGSGNSLSGAPQTSWTKRAQFIQQVMTSEISGDQARHAAPGSMHSKNQHITFSQDSA